MKSFLPKLFFAFAFMYLTFVAPRAFAANTPGEGAAAAGKDYVNQSFGIDLNGAYNGKVNLGGTTATVFNGQVCYLGVMVAGALPCALPDANGVATGVQGYIQDLNKRSALTGVTNTMAYMYANPPADLAYWMRDTGQTLGFIPKSANAQGIGFNGLAPLLPIWKAMRNIAYMLMAIIMVVVGFMVMLRRKIDPKTVVTVQSALPKIVITLLLITFSYAIAGLMIDIMYLAMTLGIAILTTSLPTGSQISIFGKSPDLINGGMLDLYLGIMAPFVNNTGLTSILAQSATTAGQRFGLLFSGASGWAELLRQAGSVNILGLLTDTAGNVIIGTLGQVILSLAFIFAFIRIFFMLLSSYIHILLAVVIGPIQILMDALPGGEGFSSWLKNIFMQLVAFPVTVFMLILGSALSSGNFGTSQAVPLWQPPFLPQIGGGVGGLASMIIWLGLILTIPTIVNGIRESLKTKPFLPAGAGAAMSPLREGFQSATGALSLFYYGKQLIPGKKEEKH